MIPIFFGFIACSWMPHWSCHYYRLETHSSFIVGNFNFSNFDSWIFMMIYSLLIGMNLVSISYANVRYYTALSSGILHFVLAIIHIIRIFKPFTFVVFGFDWSMGSSLREIIVLFFLGALCFIVSTTLKGKGDKNIMQ